MGGWVDGWFSRSMGGVQSYYLILNNLDLMKIIKFCLKIYDLLRHLHLWVGVWVKRWGQVK